MENTGHDGVRRLLDAIAQGGAYEHRVKGEELPEVNIQPDLPLGYIAVSELDKDNTSPGNVTQVEFRSQPHSEQE